jgi:hypothetical protein
VIPTLAERSRQRQLRALAQRLPQPPLLISAEPPLGLLAYLGTSSPPVLATGEGAAELEAGVQALPQPSPIENSACAPDPVESMAASAMASISTAVPPERPVTALPQEQPVPAARRAEALELMLWLLLLVLDGSLAVLELRRRLIGRATLQRAMQRLKPRRRAASAPLAAVAPTAAMTA